MPRLRPALPLLALLAAPTAAEWTNRYPKIANVSHHVYLEGFNLPTFSTSPTDPAPSPDGRSVAFAARGWLWIMDVATRQARRVTRGAGVDARPAWSPDGRSIAFTRDTGRDTAVMLMDVATGATRMLVDSPALDLDPAFAPDGRTLLYSSAEAGDLDIWRVDLDSGARTRITETRGQELNPQGMADGAIAYVGKTGYADSVHLLPAAGGSPRVLRADGHVPQLRVSAAPDGRALAITAPDDDRYQLQLIGAEGGGGAIRLAPDARYPLTPAWGRDGGVWFVQPGADERFRLRRVPATGGTAEDLSPLSWDMGARTATLTIRTRRADANLPARVAVTDGDGHPAAPATGISYFDGQHGRVFFHSPGVVTVEVPAGPVTVQATHGFDGAARIRRTLRAGEAATIDVDLPTTGWDGGARGWYAADLHSHLNYGGPYQLEPDDLVTAMRAEALDVATPQLANLQTHLIDRRWWGWARTERPLIRFAQEVRSHFLGHVGVVGADALFTPWFFGPGYPAYDRLEVTNADALRFARAHGGLGVYVHPVATRDPFPAGGEPAGLPLELVPDAVLGDVDAIELACLWSDELGTAEAWYRLLNIGAVVMPSAGSDTMHNFHRTMAIGAARVVAQVNGPLSVDRFLSSVREGRSFVTTGPMLEFKLGGAGPGGVVPGGGRVAWTLDSWAATPFETAEILVNGRVVWSGGGGAGKRSFRGEVDVPAGGWVAARVRGGASAWPTQDSYPFAHTAPVWLGARGSTDPAAARAAAADLLRWVTVADRRLATGYPDAAGVRVKSRFAEARRRLEAIASGGSVTAGAP